MFGYSVTNRHSVQTIASANLNTTGLLHELESSAEQLEDSGACCSTCTCESHLLTFDNSDVLHLCKVLDRIFTKGLVIPAAGYWPFVKEFLSRSLVDDIRLEWKPKSNLALSHAWLYFVLNEGSLPFFLSSMKHAKAIVNKYYSASALIYDANAIDAVANIVKRLDSYKFELTPDYKKLRSPASGTGTSTPNSCVHVTNGENSNNKERNLVRRTDAPLARLKGSRRLPISPSGKMTVMSSDSSKGVTKSLAQDFETPVADFSECPNVLGVDVENDASLSRTELCSEATEASFSFSESILSFKSVNRDVIKSKKQALTGAGRALPRQKGIVSKLDHRPIMRTMSELTTNRTVHSQMEHDKMIAQNSNSGVVVSRPDYTNSLFNRPEFTTSRNFDFYSEGAAVTPPRDFTYPLSDPVLTSTPNFSLNSLEVSYNAQTPPTALFFMSTDSNNDKNLADPIHVDRERRVSPEGCNSSDDAQLLPGDDVIVGYEKPEFGLIDNDELLLDQANNNVPNEPDEFEAQIIRRLKTVSSKHHLHKTESSHFDRGSVSDDTSSEITSSGIHSAVANLFNAIEQPNPSDSKRHKQSHASEILLESGEVVDLTMNVLSQEGEQFYKMFAIYCNHHIGSPSLRYLVISNISLYLVRKRSKTVGAYVAESELTFDKIGYITVSLNYQSFCVYQRLHSSMLGVCTADKSILSSLEVAMRRCSSKPELPNVITNSVTQVQVLAQWASSELKLEQSKCKPLSYNLVYFRNIDWDPATTQSPSRSGYLFWREVEPNAWYWQKPEWNKSFFMLRNKKLYQFSDSTCRVGEKVFDLRDKVIGCRKVSTKEYPHCIDIITETLEMGATGELHIQLACTLQHDMQQWLQALTFSLSHPDTNSNLSGALPCCCVLTSQHILMCQENCSINFVRTLAMSTLQHVVNISVCREYCSIAMEVSPEAEHAGVWITCFACLNEFDSFLSLFGSVWKSFYQQEICFDELNASETLVLKCKEVYEKWFSNF